jgi:hypothetical protein
MRDTVVVSVRMPESLRERLNEKAERDVRSLSQEIVWLLNYALDDLDRMYPPRKRRGEVAGSRPRYDAGEVDPPDPS